MQAIILAAGMGRRLGDYTRDNTKCMVEMGGVKIIDRLLAQLGKLDLKRVVIVTGYKGDNLRSHLRDNYHGPLSLEFVDNPIYDKTNNIYSLSLAKEQLTEDDTLLIESDLVVSDRLLPMIVENDNPDVALVAKYESWMDGTMVRIDAENNIVNFVPKQAFNFEDSAKYYKTVNIYKFSANFSRNVYVPFLDAYCAVLGRNQYYEEVLRVITLVSGYTIKALPIGKEKWYEIDDVQDLDIAETIFAEDDEMLHRFNMRYGGHWRFPKMLDYCYLVNPYFPTPHLRDELRANFDTLLCEYPSGMFVNSLLAGKYFGVKQQYMVVGNGAAELIKSMMELCQGGVGVVYPTFEEYPHRLSRDRIVAYMPEGKDLSYTADDLMRFYADKQISTLLLINPDNPSGNFIPVDDVLRLCQWCKERAIRFVVDESFVDFTDNFEHNSLLHNDILAANSNLVVMKSISKSYGVPGLRLGVMASCDKQLTDFVKKDIAIWNINSFAEFYMQIFNKYEADYRQACHRFVAERKRFERGLRKIPYLKVLPTQANYFCCRVTDRYTSAELTKLLLSRFNIMIKDCDCKTGLAGKNYIRMSIRNQADNDTLLEALNILAK